MVSRVMRTANERPWVNTLHISVITQGIVVDSLLSGLCVSFCFSLRSPLWMVFLMAIAGLMTLLPDTVLSLLLAGLERILYLLDSIPRITKNEKPQAF
ncbi:hypothetical protein BSQ40_24970 [Serratia fonticola]|nr:hypothetical protein BSQ40_24970 [Serratia fonticola]